MKDDVSKFSIGLSIAALLFAGILILGVLAAVLLLNSETLPQSPIIMGPTR